MEARTGLHLLVNLVNVQMSLMSSPTETMLKRQNLKMLRKFHMQCLQLFADIKESVIRLGTGSYFCGGWLGRGGGASVS
jgi:hypothetical protein